MMLLMLLLLALIRRLHMKQNGNDAADATFICASCFFPSEPQE